MNWTKWKAGILVAAIASALVTGAGLTDHITWHQAISIFCASMLTHAGAYLKDPGTNDQSKPTA